MKLYLPYLWKQKKFFKKKEETFYHVLYCKCAPSKIFKCIDDEFEDIKQQKKNAQEILMRKGNIYNQEIFRISFS